MLAEVHLIIVVLQAPRTDLHPELLEVEVMAADGIGVVLRELEPDQKRFREMLGDDVIIMQGAEGGAEDELQGGLLFPRQWPVEPGVGRVGVHL
jgi:hypothetical protein